MTLWYHSDADDCWQDQQMIKDMKEDQQGPSLKESRDADRAKAELREKAHREHMKARDARKVAERRGQGRSGHAKPHGGRHKTSGDDEGKAKAGRMLISMAFSVGNLAEDEYELPSRLFR